MNCNTAASQPALTGPRRGSTDDPDSELTEPTTQPSPDNVWRATQVVASLHTELGQLKRQKEGEEAVERMRREMAGAQEEARSWKEIAEEEMQGHVRAMREKQAVEQEVLLLREYCVKAWGSPGQPTESQADADQPRARGAENAKASSRGGQKGLGGLQIASSAFPTGDVCHRMYVMLRPTAFTAERAAVGELVRRINQQVQAPNPGAAPRIDALMSEAPECCEMCSFEGPVLTHHGRAQFCVGQTRLGPLDDVVREDVKSLASSYLPPPAPLL